jgi:HAMP domain-containing protein
MKAIQYIREHLAVQILIALSIPIALTVGAITVFGVVTVNHVASTQIQDQGNRLIETIYASMESLLPMGEEQLVNNQLHNLKRRSKDVAIAIFDFNKTIAFASDSELSGKQVGSMVDESVFHGSLDRMLGTGAAPEKPFQSTKHGIHYMTVARPILNSPECFHCHGESRKVLGGIVAYLPNEEAITAMHTAENWTMCLGLLGLILTIIPVNLMFRGMVLRPVKVLLDMAARLRNGDFTYHIPVVGRTEISHICARMNRVNQNLRKMIGETIAGTETPHGRRGAEKRRAIQRRCR